MQPAHVTRHSTRKRLHNANTPQSAMAAARFGPSTSGEMISLTYAPATMAPAAMPSGTFSAAAMPKKAMPMVPAAPHEPSTTPTTSVTTKAMGRNSSGVTTIRP